MLAMMCRNPENTTLVGRSQPQSPTHAAWLRYHTSLAQTNSQKQKAGMCLPRARQMSDKWWGWGVMKVDDD